MSFIYLYDAAAGAGKTHTLVSYYILQLLKNPDHFSNILAITFTNKATQEMKERILIYLHHLAKGESGDLQKRMIAALQCRPEKLADRAKQALQKILYHYHDLAVTTIDSFFDRVIRSFQREYKLGVDYTLELDDKQVLSRCLEEIMSTLSDYPTLAKGLIEWALHKLQQGKRWELGKEMKAIGHHILHATAAYRDLHSTLVSRSESDHIFNHLAQSAQSFRNRLRAQATKMIKIIKQAGLGVEDFSWGEKGVVGFLQKVANGSLLQPSKRVRDSIEKRWERKEGEQAAHASQLVESTLRPLLVEWIATYDEDAMLYHTVEAMLPLRYLFSLTQRIRDLVQQYENKHAKLLITHLSLLLQQTMQEVSDSDLFLKLGNVYNILLIDELQDVSLSQWASLVPLLRSSLAKGEHSLLVGDVKQSIYRWRGGDPQIFLHGVEKDLEDQAVKRKALRDNWRSGAHIINFNNTFFAASSEAITNALLAEVNQENPDQAELIKKNIKQIKQSYQNVKQSVAQRTPPLPAGSVEVHLLADKKKEESSYHWKEHAIQLTIQQIEKLQKKGYLPQDIALLVRDHAEAQSLLQGLMAYQVSPHAQKDVSYEAAATSGLTISDHPTIMLLVSTLAYLYNQEDQYALATLLYYYHATRGKEEAITTKMNDYAYLVGQNQLKAQQYLPSLFYTEQDHLKSLPLDRLIVKLVVIFDLQKEEAIPYLRRFQEAVHDFVKQQQGGIVDFLSWWQKRGAQVKLASQATHHMQIMTIHQSKGLAFKAVLLPFCNWRLDHSPYYPPIIWGETHDSRLAPLGSLPLYYGQHLKATYFSSVYYQEKWRIYLEQFNLLYVACTRAIDYLFMVAPSRSQAGSMTHVADLIKQVMKEHYETVEHEHFVIGEIGQKNSNYLVAKLIIPPTSNYHSHVQHIDTLLASLASPAHPTGVWWHALLASIKTRNDLAPLLTIYQARGAISEKERVSITKTLSRWWKNDLIFSWFSHEWEIKIEVPIMLPNGSIVRPDRIMLHNQQAVVVDFKTGLPKQADQKQVSTYRKLLRQMGYAPVKGYLLHIATGHLTSVV
ncbi:MAG: UvrD-helicase domain-containing protein [Bacteroidota bacterium]